MTAVDQRERILDAALGLMAERGSAGMSMRSLASACDLNVATLYHYFPSKHDLYRAAIEHGRYDALLADRFTDGIDGPPPERLATLLDRLCREMLETEELWRVLLAECLHGDEEVLEPILGMSAAFEEALGRWLEELFPEIPALAEPAFVHAIRHALYGMLIECLPQPDARGEALAARARELADVFTRLACAPDRRPGRPSEAPPDPRGARP